MTDRAERAQAYATAQREQEKSLRAAHREKVATDPTFTTPWYGVTWDEADSDPMAVTRIASDMDLHRTLPIQSRMRRCVVRDGVVRYHLHEDDSSLQADGVTPARLDGSDGDVMVEVPGFFYRWITDGTRRSILISEWGDPEFRFSPPHLLSAYECTIDRETGALASVCTSSFVSRERSIRVESPTRRVAADDQAGIDLGVHTTVELTGHTASAARYRGVTNDVSLDCHTDPGDRNTARNQLGRPVSNINRRECRAHAEAAGGLIQQYASQRALTFLVWVEYATRQIQQPFAPDDADGFRTGGLGDGAVKYPSYEAYEKYFAPQGGNAVLPCGVTNGLGNRSGEVQYLIRTVPVAATGALAEAEFTAWGDVWMPVHSYRGIENFYGHLYTIVDNIDVVVTPSGEGEERTNQYWYQPNPYLCTDTDSLEGYTHLGSFTFPSSIKVIDRLLGGPDGHILPISSSGRDMETYYCDCVEHITGWRGNTVAGVKYLTYNGRLVSEKLVGLLFSVVAIDVDSDRRRRSDTVRLQYMI